MVKNVVVCANCHHNRSVHKKIDGNAWCSVQFCACKNFIEREIPFERRKFHEAADQLIDDFFGLNPSPPTDPEEKDS